jgi:UDP-glucose 4-epimerase
MSFNILNKKILVTGGTGQVGSFLVEKLIEEGANIFVIGRNKNRLKEIKNLVETKKITFLECDLTKEDQIKNISSSLIHIDFLVHLSSELSTPSSNLIENARHSIDLNIKGVIFLLKFCKNLKGILYGSTTAVYEKLGLSLDENFQTNPSSMYGCGKLGAEKYLKLFSSVNMIPLTILRYSTIYGPRNRTNQIIPRIINQALMNEQIKINGNGQTFRDFIYISDVIRATIKSIKKNENGIYNIGTGERIKINELVKKIIYLTNSKSKIIFEGENDDLGFVSNSNRIEKNLGFKFKISINEGLKKEIEWKKCLD